jgi:hypothetical protein
MEKPILKRKLHKKLIFSTYLSSCAKNVRYMTRAAPHPHCTLDKPSFFALKNNCVFAFGLTAKLSPKT